MRRGVITAVAATVALGCNFSQAGINPTESTLNFPMALAVSPATNADGEPQFLFVANSNFDLRFNAGSLMAFDLDAVDRLLDERCGGGAPDCELWPIRPLTASGVDMESGREVAPIIADEVGIGSHADGLAVNAAGDRMYLPMRGEGDLTFVPFSAGQPAFRCDQATRENEGEPDIPRCADRFRTGHEGGVASTRELTVSGSPVAVATGDLRALGSTADADFVVMAQADGSVALFLDRHDGDGSPELIHIAEGFPQNAINVTMQPGLGVGWITSVGTNTIARVGITVDTAEPTRSFLYNFGAARLGGVDDGEDTRDMQFHPTDPSRAFVLSRRPEAVIEVAVERRGFTQSDVAIVDLWEVGAGPSRLVVTVIDGTTYALASCFDAQRLFVIDVDHGALVGVVGGFSGPFEIVVDEARQRVYMADFSTSVIRVVGLAGLTEGRSPEVLGRLGELRPVSSVTD